MYDNIFDRLFWQLYLWRYVPRNLWYCDFHGKTVMVVPARIMEGHFRDSNNGNYLGARPFRLWTHFIGGTDAKQHELIFSDDPKYRGEAAQRYPSGVIGSLSDFRLFCGSFVVMRRSLHIPSFDRLQHEGRTLGQMDDPADMVRVIDYARKIYQNGRTAILW